MRRRTGVGLGGRGSLRAMLGRSFGASSLSGFWRYWNPIWSYGLSRYINAPLARMVGRRSAILLTFVASGLLHDLVIMALRGSLTLIFVPWFALSGAVALAGDALGWTFENWPTPARALTIGFYLLATFLLALASARQTGLY